MTDEEKTYVANLEALVTARTEQLRTAVNRVAELEKLLEESRTAHE